MSDSEEPYAGKPHVRFCEGEPEQSMVKLVRHCQTKGAATDRFDLNRYPGSLLDHLTFGSAIVKMGTVLFFLIAVNILISVIGNASGDRHH